VIATATASKLADYVVTEAGFGADLGAEKFIDIKCRKSGLQPSAVVLVATVRALKYHGGVAVKDLAAENLPALEKGMVNLQKHLHNIRTHYGLPCVVAINHRTEDTAAEIAMLEKACAQYGAKVVVPSIGRMAGQGRLIWRMWWWIYASSPTSSNLFTTKKTVCGTRRKLWRKRFTAHKGFLQMPRPKI